MVRYVKERGERWRRAPKICEWTGLGLETPTGEIPRKACLMLEELNVELGKNSSVLSGTRVGMLSSK